MKNAKYFGISTISEIAWDCENTMSLSKYVFPTVFTSLLRHTFPLEQIYKSYNHFRLDSGITKCTTEMNIDKSLNLYILRERKDCVYNIDF